MPEARIRTTLLSNRPSGGSQGVALGTTLALFLGTQIYWNDKWGAHRWMPAGRKPIYEDGEAFRAFTSLAAHADFKHFLSNAFLFFIFGTLLRGYYGTRLFPWTTLLLGALTNALAAYTYVSGTTLIGASGMVYAMGGLWLTLYLLVARHLRLRGRLLRMLGTAAILFLPETFEPQISYRAHAIGFVVGVAYGILHYWRWRPAFHALETHEEPDEDSIEPRDEVPSSGFSSEAPSAAQKGTGAQEGHADGDAPQATAWDEPQDLEEWLEDNEEPARPRRKGPPPPTTPPASRPRSPGRRGY